MTHPYLTEAELRYGNFSGILTTGKSTYKKTKSAKNMYFDNPWDFGNGYIGPMPTPENPEKMEVMATLKRQFTPANKIKEVVDRVLDALLSRSPNWEIIDKSKLLTSAIEQETMRQSLHERIDTANQSVEELLAADPTSKKTPPKSAPPKRKFNLDEGGQPVDDETKRLVEAEIMLGQLWQTTDLKENIKRAFLELLLTGNGKLRSYIKRRFKDLQNKGLSDDEILFESIKYIGTEFIENLAGKVLDDDGDKMSIVRVDKKFGNNSGKFVEVTFVGSDFKTYIAIFDATGAGNQTTVEPDLSVQQDDTMEILIARVRSAGGQISEGLALDENIMVEELTGDPFVTQSMIQQNRALNLDLSLGVSVLVENGFVEMVTSNADLEEVIGQDADGNDIIAERVLVRGPSAAINLQGNQSVDKDGTVHFEKPGVMFKDPVSIEVFDKGERLYYRQILAEARQEFVLMVGDSTTTGESRIQSRQDFLKKCQQYKNPLDKFCSRILTTLLHLAADISGKPDYFKGIVVNFDSKISAGELSAAEQQVIVSRYQAQLISRETALTLLGTEDPIVEIDKIRLDEAEAQDSQVRRLVAASKFSMMVQAQNSDPNNPQPAKPPKTTPLGGV